MTVMAVDYGDRHTGVAISDPTGTIPGYADVIDEWNTERLADKVAALTVERGAELIVVGRPLNMNGTAGPRAEKSEAFAELLRSKVTVEVKLWDERLTSVSAGRILTESGKRGSKKKAKIDAVAAALILESYLDSLR